ncbi:MAG: 2-iminobutanoate/2-iminopropanoate deaminase [candidate division WS2 bacterium]|uniref:2-iminobutanoate/2-iminopropanoate deaminase n=1 Tax=Psychracetigena formicireducens TaxID=2986056 RepID=A0A9E2BHX8_PSYF1|nr:2-iminobutanoate/2-iminopropanoate deaminase [Candidatus Psychracetigena formicireducens]
MEKKIIYTSKAPAPIGPYSQAVQAGNMLFVSGQIPLNESTGLMEQETIEQETHRVMHNIEAILKEAGCTFANILKTSIFVTDLANFGKINEVYATYFTQNPPARETIEICALPKGANVEISCIAICE